MIALGLEPKLPIERNNTLNSYKYSGRESNPHNEDWESSRQTNKAPEHKSCAGWTRTSGEDISLEINSLPPATNSATAQLLKNWLLFFAIEVNQFKKNAVSSQVSWTGIEPA